MGSTRPAAAKRAVMAQATSDPEELTTDTMPMPTGTLRRNNFDQRFVDTARMKAKLHRNKLRKLYIEAEDLKCMHVSTNEEMYVCENTPDGWPNLYTMPDDYWTVCWAKVQRMKARREKQKCEEFSPFKCMACKQVHCVNHMGAKACGMPSCAIPVVCRNCCKSRTWLDTDPAPPYLYCRVHSKVDGRAPCECGVDGVPCTKCGLSMCAVHGVGRWCNTCKTPTVCMICTAQGKADLARRVSQARMDILRQRDALHAADRIKDTNPADLARLKRVYMQNKAGLARRIRMLETNYTNTAACAKHIRAVRGGGNNSAESFTKHHGGDVDASTGCEGDHDHNEHDDHEDHDDHGSGLSDCSASSSGAGRRPRV